MYYKWVIINIKGIDVQEIGKHTLL